MSTGGATGTRENSFHWYQGLLGVPLKQRKHEPPDLYLLKVQNPQGSLYFSTVDLKPVYFQSPTKVLHGLKSLPASRVLPPPPPPTLKLTAAGRSFKLLSPGHSLGLTAWSKSIQKLRSQFLEGFLGHMGDSGYMADCTDHWYWSTYMELIFWRLYIGLKPTWKCLQLLVSKDLVTES